MDQKIQKNVYSFGDALVMTGFGTFNYLITILCGVITISLIFETLGFSFIITAAQCDLNLSIAEKGILGAMPLVGLMTTSQLWGYMADTKGRRKIMMASMITSSCLSMISSLSPNYTTIIILKLLSTAGMSGINAVLFAYFGEMMPKTHVDMMISILSSVFYVSSVFGTGIAWGVLTYDFNIPLPLLDIVFRPWRLLVICYAFPFLICSLGMYFAPESPKFMMSQGRSDEVLELLKRIYTLNTGKDSSDYLVDDILIDEQDELGESSEKKTFLKSIWSQISPLFTPPLLIYSFITFTLAFGVIGSVNPFFMWLPDLIDRFFVAVDDGQAESKTFCDLMSVRSVIRKNYVIDNSLEYEVCDDSFKPNSYSLMMMLSGFVTIVNIIVAILLKWVPKKIILIVLLGSSASAILLIHFIKNFYIAWFLILLFQCCGPTGGIINAYIVELFPTQYRAMSSSFMLMFGRFGGIIGTNIFGWLIEVNCTANFLVYASLLVVCTLIAMFLPNNSGKKNQQKIPS